MHVTPSPQMPIRTVCQAERIRDRFGGRAAFHRALDLAGQSRSRVTSWRWMQPSTTHGGTNGLVPSRSIPRVKAAALAAGVILTAEDWLPITLDDTKVGLGERIRK